jgi:hypothetical protein
MAVAGGGSSTVTDWANCVSSEIEEVFSSEKNILAGSSEHQTPVPFTGSRLRAFVSKHISYEQSKGTLSSGTSGTSAAVATAGGQSSFKKTKLSSLFDGTAEAEVVLMDPVKVRNTFDIYEQVRGEPPHPDIEPPFEQLSAEAQIVGADAVLYVEFAIGRPIRQRRHQAHDPHGLCVHPGIRRMEKSRAAGPGQLRHLVQIVAGARWQRLPG